MADDDPPHPWSVEVPCPTEGCPQTLKIRWPPGNPDTTTVRCHRCGEETEVAREESEEIDS